jgi:hypothetical protein
MTDPNKVAETPIKRYTFAVYGDCDHWMEESAGGTWISYEDHQRELAAANAEIERHKRLHSKSDEIIARWQIMGDRQAERIAELEAQVSALVNLRDAIIAFDGGCDDSLVYLNGYDKVSDAIREYKEAK